MEDCRELDRAKGVVNYPFVLRFNGELFGIVLLPRVFLMYVS